MACSSSVGIPEKEGGGYIKVRTFNYKPLGGATETLMGRAAADGRLRRT